MYEVNPWNDDIKKKLLQLTKDGVTYIADGHCATTFGRKYPELFDENKGFLDIGRIDKRNKSMIVRRPNVGIVPMPGKKNTKFRFYKIF